MKAQACWQPWPLKGKKKWFLPALSSFLFLFSVAMTSCFLWQYHPPKLQTGSWRPEVTPVPVRMCPRHPELVPLAHPLPMLKEALDKVDGMLRQAMSAPGLAAMSALVIHNDTVLWTGNFGKKNGSDPNSGPPNEYTMYRISSISKIFPVLMLYRLWEEGIVASLDDPLERYASTFSINNPLGVAPEPEPQGPNGEFDDVGPIAKPSPVTLRRMASQLSGLCTRVVQCRGQKRVSDSPGTGVKDGSQLPCGCYRSNRGPLQEQSALLTARPSLRPPNMVYFLVGLPDWAACRHVVEQRQEQSRADGDWDPPM